MTLFLRDKDNNTIVDIELFVKNNYVGLHSVVCIDTYSKFLLENIDRKDEIIFDFDMLSELRGWLWEVYKENSKEKFDDILKYVRTLLNKKAEEYGLYYVED